MDINDLNQLDFNDFGEWPNPVKGVAILIACVALGGLAYYYDTSGQLDRLAGEQKTELELRTSLATKQQKAANLQAYRDQLAEMEESFGAMLKQLPNRTEVASLLVDVSQTGLANGLEFELFQPENEQVREFYAELPIRIRVRGQYHDFGRFVSGLAALPRIVTIHNVQVTDGDESLVLQATVKTYRYLEDEAK
ncbi:type 4a pilus biogenesis protein PilO [Allochromatium palmeri]|uniref:Type 4a pilus biogenesis protein PilO n=1 Tax=Allochromatium palmeri TaxID=231048 RepID=A0A6N8EJ58_9GAMM|nr:type 4a pilus biogenesis protein PilO [Allochromatium palmeri]MTW22364.1 type 4a pilus biogenesis protein PilO [Allochromatium palmeri]